MKAFFLFLLTGFSFAVTAQYQAPFYLKITEPGERTLTYGRIVNNIILKNLAIPLTDSSEDEWEGAFNAMEIVNYTSGLTEEKMRVAMDSLANRSVDFQRATLEAAYALYPGKFTAQAAELMNTTGNAKIFAICAVYLYQASPGTKDQIQASLQKSFGDSALVNPILLGLQRWINPEEISREQKASVLKQLISASFLKGQTVLYSFQRKDRNYPGMVMVRKKDGSFVKAGDDYFHVPQLARGIANLPYFLTKGNTPQGLYRMFGFGVSLNQSIGPTANVQMGMPVELTKKNFFDNVSDTSGWTIDDYAKLLPESLRQYKPLYETYLAGAAGRNEIIAHGSTINPEYYVGKTYYPLTPTEGCLATKEFWDGKLVYSDQEKLVNALLAAGGAYGYVLVIEMEDQQRPVTLEDVLPWLPKGT